jgi:hypothetical protein
MIDEEGGVDGLGKEESTQQIEITKGIKKRLGEEILTTSRRWIWVLTNTRSLFLVRRERRHRIKQAGRCFQPRMASAAGS